MAEAMLQLRSLTVNEILEKLNSPEPENVVSSIPFRPKGGSCFLFQPKAPSNKNDWKADGHSWSNQGNRKPLPRSNPRYFKSYFYLRKDGKTTKDFKKEVYFPLEGDVCLIHYVGDEKLSVPSAHGNSEKPTKFFFRTKPSVREEAFQRTEKDKAHIVYKEMVVENKDGHDAISKPRDLKQLHNVRAAKKEEIRLSKDAIINTHEIAYEGDFVHSITTYPDLCVVLGDREVIAEMNEIVKLRDPNFLLSYDTTFCLGDFYVSPLVFKNILFDQQPLMGGMFLVHERKLHSTHDELFKTFSSLVKPLNNLPIVTDMEAGIIRSIREQTKLRQVGCWRHLRKDVQRWLVDHVPYGNRSQYINDLFDIIRSESEVTCHTIIERKKLSWSADFVKHFEKNIEPKLEFFCVWSIKGICPYHPLNGITTNISEGFNYLLKDFQNWKEVPLDCLVMSLKMLQGFYLEETRRGKAGLGSYTLKVMYSDYATNVDNFCSRSLVCHPKDIVASIRNKDYKPMDERILSIQDEFSSNSRIVRAKELVQKDQIVFSYQP